MNLSESTKRNTSFTLHWTIILRVPGNIEYNIQYDNISLF